METNDLSPKELDMRLLILELVVTRLFAAQELGDKLSATEMQQEMHAYILHVTQRPRQVPPEFPLEDWQQEMLGVEVRYSQYTDRIFGMVRSAIQEMKKA